MTQLSLMHPTPPTKTAREQWIAKLRTALYREHAGEDVTADEAAALMDARPELRRPHHVHPNSIGPLFSTWEKAEPVMIGDGEHRQQMRKMSPRGNNDIRVWHLKDEN